ncbi:MAG TPA: EAL domain-containing protein, partial [Chloroflexota bacterium]|nr:EAL domain-containing protein [Chloroflexota bacterium]
MTRRLAHLCHSTWFLAVAIVALAIIGELTLRWPVLLPLAVAGGWSVRRSLAQARAANVETEDRYRRLVEFSPDPIVVYDMAGVIMYANPASLAMVAATSMDDVLGHNVTDFVHEEFRSTIKERAQQAVDNNESSALVEVTLVRVDGEYIQAESASMPTVYVGQPAIQVVLRDITERKRAEADLAYQARHDSLTGLANRTSLLDQLRAAIAKNTHTSLLLLDLDRFKEVNDTLGHHAGDALLQQVGARLRGVLRDAHCIARLGGDEFAAIVPAVHASDVGEHLLRMFERPYQIQGQPVVIGTSIGIVQYPEHGQDADTLLRRADIAMYEAKRNGASAMIYEPSHDRRNPDRLAMIGDLRRAIEDSELVLYFQPKVDLRTGALDGVEALARWQHPLRGLIAPDQFIPVAEQAGLIDALTHWVIRAALRQCRAWRRSGMDIPVAVNLSVRNLLDAKLPDTIAALLKEHDVPASLLSVEITESTLMSDPARSLAVLERLRGMGITIAIDDFGTGQSSMSYLKR